MHTVETTKEDEREEEIIEQKPEKKNKIYEPIPTKEVAETVETPDTTKNEREEPCVRQD